MPKGVGHGGGHQLSPTTHHPSGVGPGGRGRVPDREDSRGLRSIRHVPDTTPGATSEVVGVVRPISTELTIVDSAPVLGRHISTLRDPVTNHHRYGTEVHVLSVPSTVSVVGRRVRGLDVAFDPREVTDERGGRGCDQGHRGPGLPLHKRCQDYGVDPSSQEPLGVDYPFPSVHGSLDPSYFFPSPFSTSP